MPALILDVILVLVLLVYLGEGFRNGFSRSLGAILGTVAGGVAAFFAMPLVAAAVPEAAWRSPAAIGSAVVLLFGGYLLGGAIGRAIRRSTRSRRLGAVDRVLGAAVNVVTAALVTALIAGSVAGLGIPVLSTAVQGSTTIRIIDQLTPAPLAGALARLRAAVLEQGLPTISDALGGVTTSPGIPDIDTATDPLTTAAGSVVRITGTAYACGQNQSGSGFVVAPDRIVTNAHVVAGVAQPVVEAPNGQALDGRVVYVDSDDDLAVIAVSGLQAPALALSPTLAPGDDAVVDGYPFGGPFVTGAATVLSVSTENIANIYGTGSTPREVYALAATVNPGNSGGPLLTTDGTVAGVVFAKAAARDDLGYAMTGTELAPVAQGAAALTQSVDPGSCIRG